MCKELQIPKKKTGNPSFKKWTKDLGRCFTKTRHPGGPQTWHRQDTSSPRADRSLQ